MKCSLEYLTSLDQVSIDHIWNASNFTTPPHGNGNIFVLGTLQFQLSSGSPGLKSINADVQSVFLSTIVFYPKVFMYPWQPWVQNDEDELRETDFLWDGWDPCPVKVHRGCHPPQPRGNKQKRNTCINTRNNTCSLPFSQPPFLCLCVLPAPLNSTTQICNQLGSTHVQLVELNSCSLFFCFRNQTRDFNDRVCGSKLPVALLRVRPKNTARCVSETFS